MRRRSQWVPLAIALLITAGLGLAAVAAPPRALAEDNGLAVNAPLLGWTSWGYNQRTPTAAEDEADAAALVSTGLKADGYLYVNQDDF